MTRILVVDDVKLFRHMEATVLAFRGYHIEEASSGTEALMKIRAEPPDLVLLDYYMPGMTGQEVCQQIKLDPATKDLPVIIVTSSTRDEDVRRAVQAGCDDYLTKPLDDNALIRKVELLLGGAAKRRFPRVSTSMQISFEDFRGIFFEFSRDLSRSGVFIEMDKPLSVGTRLRLSFSLPAPFGRPVLAYGRVVRSSPAEGDRPGGVGVSFIHVDDASAKAIDSLVSGTVIPIEETKGFFSRVQVQLDEPEVSREDPRVTTLANNYSELQSAKDELERDHVRLSAMLAISEGFITAETPALVLSTAIDVLQNLLGAERRGIFLHDPARNVLIPIGSEATSPTGMPLEGPVLTALREGSASLCRPPWPVARTVLLAVAPIRTNSEILGVLTLHELFPQKPALEPIDLQLLEMLGRHFGQALTSAVARLKTGPISPSAILAALQ